MTRSRKRKLQRLQAGQSARRLATGLPLAPLILAGMPIAYAQAQENAMGTLEEVVVTAQKQTENLQSVPMSIQAFGTTKLEELRINNMTEYMQYMPSVSFQTAGPGFTQVFMRGVANGSNGNHSGPMPSVGQYLDEQPITTIQGSLDIHIYDIERVEMLAGPQGTLYGASSQSGTIRTITNKPDPTAFSASYDVQGNFVSNGDAGYIAEGYTNIPLGDSAAVRLVGWYDHTPGFIDNVKGSMVFPETMVNPDDPDGDRIPGPPVTMTNYEPGHNFHKDNYNDGNTYGGRALLKIDLNDSWSIMPGVMGQVADYNGVNAFDPSVGELQLTHFFKEDSHDAWVQASLTVLGKIGNWDMTYNYAYLDRSDETRSDYSDYGYWYDVCCGSGTYFYNDDGEFISPAQHIKGKDGYKMWSTELRFSSPRDNRLRFTGGLFAQSDEHRIEQRYMVDELTSYYWVPGWSDTIWLTEQTRVDNSYAAFGELYYDITDKLTATAGIRLFQTDSNLKGFFGYGAGFSSNTGEAKCFNSDKYHGAPCINLNKSTDEDGNTPKLNLAYKFTDSAMAYLTYSEGFRPGGVNRRSSYPGPGEVELYPPYKADYLTNYEAGWKTEWAGGKVRFNGAFFLEEWDKFQYAYLGINGLTLIKNAGQAQITGVETYVDWAVTSQFRLSAGATWLDPKLTQSFCQDAVQTDPCPSESFAPKDTRLPATPTFKGNVIGRYSFNIGEYDTDIQGSYVYQNDVEAELLPFNRQFTGKQDGYGVADFSASMRKGPYSLTLFVNNAFDEHAELFKYQECDVGICGAAGQFNIYSDPPGGPSVYPSPGLPHAYTTYTGTNQPRTIGLIFRQEF